MLCLPESLLDEYEVDISCLSLSVMSRHALATESVAIEINEPINSYQQNFLLEKLLHK